MRRRSVKMTRAARRVFANKAQPSVANIRQQFIPRGGGWL